MTGPEIWGPSIVAAVVATVMAAAFTWLFGWRTEREHRQGVRTLISNELLHNKVMLLALRSSLTRALHADDPKAAATGIREVAWRSQWQRSRWDLPDVGVALSRDEVMRISDWYLGLDHLTFIYEGLLATVDARYFDANLRIEAESGVAGLVTGDMKEQLEKVVAFANRVYDACPPFPDEQVERSLSESQRVAGEDQTLSAPTQDNPEQ